MYHPLLGNPKDLKDNDIDFKIADLSRKYAIASRSGQGGLCEQIASVLDVYKSEQLNRQYAATQKMIKTQNKDLDGLINID